MDGGDAAYASSAAAAAAARRSKSLRATWTLVTSSFAFVVLLCALCLFFFFHPRTCRHLYGTGGTMAGSFASTETILDEIRAVDYDQLDTGSGTIDVRLPDAVVPDSYSVRIVPFLWAGNATFDGQVDIVVNVTAAVDSVTLHAVDMNVTECLVSR